jgi:hypothetical protein
MLRIFVVLACLFLYLSKKKGERFAPHVPKFNDASYNVDAL